MAIHDCWASYLAYVHCGHGLCGSHLLRELAFVVETNAYSWAVNMKRLLKETRALVAKRPDKQLSETEYKNPRKCCGTSAASGSSLPSPPSAERQTRPGRQVRCP